MKVAELEGPRLDYWVGKAAGLQVRLECYMNNPPRPIECWLVDGGMTPYRPSSDWAVGGLIIERVGIDLDVARYQSDIDKTPHSWVARVEVATDDGESFKSWYAEAKTPLLAAMRAYVMSKFGEEVEGVTK